MSFLKINNNRSLAKAESNLSKKADKTASIDSSEPSNFINTDTKKTSVNWSEPEESDIVSNPNLLSSDHNRDKAQQENANALIKDMDMQSIWISSTPLSISPRNNKLSQANITTPKTPKHNLYFKTIKYTINTLKYLSLIFLLLMLVTYMENNKPDLPAQPQNPILNIQDNKTNTVQHDIQKIN